MVDRRSVCERPSHTCRGLGVSWVGSPSIAFVSSDICFAVDKINVSDKDVAFGAIHLGLATALPSG